MVYDYTKNQNTPNYSQLINYNPNGFNVGTYTNPTTGAVGTSLFFNGAACNVTVGGVTTNPCIRPLSPIVVVSGRNRQGVAEIGVPQQPSVDRTHGLSGTIKYKALDNLELRSITAWRGVSTNQWDNSGGAHRTTFAPNTPFSRYSLSELFQNQLSQDPGRRKLHQRRLRCGRLLLQRACGRGGRHSEHQSLERGRHELHDPERKRERGSAASL